MDAPTDAGVNTLNYKGNSQRKNYFSNTRVINNNGVNFYVLENKQYKHFSNNPT